MAKGGFSAAMPNESGLQVGESRDISVKRFSKDYLFFLQKQ